MKKVTEETIRDLEEKIKGAKEDLIIVRKNAEDYRAVSTDAFVQGKDPVIILNQRRALDGKVELLEDGIASMEASLAEMKKNLPNYQDAVTKAEARQKAIEADQVEKIVKSLKAIFAAWEAIIEGAKQRAEASVLSREFEAESTVQAPEVCLIWGDYELEELERILHHAQDTMPAVFAKAKIPDVQGRLNIQFGG